MFSHGSQTSDSNTSEQEEEKEEGKDLEVLTVQVALMSGQELEPVRIVATQKVIFMCQEVLRKLCPSVQRISLLHEGNVLPMQATVGSCLRDGDAVMVLVRPNAFMLQQADLDTGLSTRLLDGARWVGETLVLDSVLACAAPRWDVVPDMQKNFAVEATIKLFEWPMPDWKGSIVSQHGSGTGWELRCGGSGVTALLTTSHGGHNELTLKWKRRDTGAWHHVCMIYEAEMHQLTVVCDGVDRASKKVYGDFQPHDDVVHVGRNPEWADRGIIGEIRNAAVWPDGFGFGLEDLPSRARARIEEAKASQAPDREETSGELKTAEPTV
ncbi:unnamed protein product [Symbiodinium sp. CCMP2592]|nr:unnamed protein product [Symbiodinium sp. CCMP2592]